MSGVSSSADNYCFGILDVFTGVEERFPFEAPLHIPDMGRITTIVDNFQEPFIFANLHFSAGLAVARISSPLDGTLSQQGCDPLV